MNKPVLAVVNLIGGKDKVILVGAKRVNEYAETDGREHQYSLTILHQADGGVPEYLINLVLLEHEIEGLVSQMPNKFIDDIGYLVTATHHKLRYLRFEGYNTDFATHLEKRFKNMDKSSGSVFANVFTNLEFYAKEKHGFTRALTEVLSNPFDGHLFNGIPNIEHTVWEV